MTADEVHAAHCRGEFTGVIGSMRGARFGRDSAWRTMSTSRPGSNSPHQITLLVSIRGAFWTSQFDWRTSGVIPHQYWFAIRFPPLLDELTLGQNRDLSSPSARIRFGNRVHQFAIVDYLASLARDTATTCLMRMGHLAFQTEKPGDMRRLDTVLAVIIETDPRVRARNPRTSGSGRSGRVLAFAGLPPDYLTELDQRPYSSRIHEIRQWNHDQYLLDAYELGLKKP